jgi:hypothetical protein
MGQTHIHFFYALHLAVGLVDTFGTERAGHPADIELKGLHFGY